MFSDGITDTLSVSLMLCMTSCSSSASCVTASYSDVFFGNVDTMTERFLWRNPFQIVWQNLDGKLSEVGNSLVGRLICLDIRRFSGISAISRLGGRR